jgi:hypothetical protein
MEKRITPTWITSLKNHEVFVFGSNMAGRHGAGAAKQAVTWGAEYGKGFGLMGKTFGIPTKDRNIMTLDLPTIEVYIEGFLLFAKENSGKKFLVTEIGCGLAAYKHSQIAPLFRNAVALTNVFMPDKFWKILFNEA